MVTLRKYIISSVFIALISCLLYTNISAQLWHNKERTLHYKPYGKDFILHQGTKKFNRALYGSNTAFRVETGDLPEFALYMPGMGGNCKIGIVLNHKSKWITETDTIKTIYRPGSMLYEIKDKLLGNGILKIMVLALADEDGMIVKTETVNVPNKLSIVIAYGGATGKKFSRDGDIGADPESSFYLQPDYCKNNQYQINKNSFQLFYGFTKPLTDDERYEIQYGKTLDSNIKDNPKTIFGLFPTNSTLKIVDANKQHAPLSLLQSPPSKSAPVITALLKNISTNIGYFVIKKDFTQLHYSELSSIFTKAEQARKKIADRIIVETPDEYINTLGGALAIAADAIWEAPTYLHGAVAWRMRLPAWRGAYAADALGWHDRAKLHFNSYLKSQVTNILPGNVTPDTTLHFARQLEKMGTAMFSNGYICRYPDGKIQPHHYDMNLVFMAQLLTHLDYTGDLDYARKIWPSLTLHLAWEKRNFDADDDGLYDAYACIWASDALQYSGGGVTHSTAYNYRANKMAAKIAKLIGEDPSFYEKEAATILTSMNNNLWLKDKGWFAEYKDILGLQRTHNAPGLWTIYHSIDEGVASPTQKFQMLRYVDQHIPHIPISAKDLPFNDLHLLSTTNWQPYTWSVNNVALAENLHTALAYWQSGENDNAFKLWKSSLIESMYLSSSPGGFQQLSFYDAVRGELYRDFADPIGMAARTLTEGLFGIHPNALNNQLIIQPGFPTTWKFANLSTPDISLAFKKNNNSFLYEITRHYEKPLNVILKIAAKTDSIKSVLINGKKASYRWLDNAFRNPTIEISAGNNSYSRIEIIWAGAEIEKPILNTKAILNEQVQLAFEKSNIQSITDAQQAFRIIKQDVHRVTLLPTKKGNYALFLNLKQGDAKWIAPVAIQTLPEINILSKEHKNYVQLTVTNNSLSNKTGYLITGAYKTALTITANSSYKANIPSTQLNQGHNKVIINWDDSTSFIGMITCWNANTEKEYKTININDIVNDKVSNTFKHQLFTPRSNTTTLQIPWQGIGNWCYPLIQPIINDSGIANKEIIFLEKIPFKINQTKNIAYTSLWNNFPDSVLIALSGKASQAYLLMAGTTNHQQSYIPNGIINIEYTDGTKDSLQLINPVNWWPIEQDYMNDGYAFTSNSQPYRLLFKTGTFTRNHKNYTTIKGFTNMAIDGGAGTVIDIPLDKEKELKSLTIKTLSNEVLIGLMALTLISID
ncbi:MAG: DUF4450 domain-containing protein [Niabella sp.]